MTNPVPGPETALPLTESTFCILAALVEPRHGYGIMQWVAEATGDRVKLGPGTLYGAMSTLQGKGFISPVGDSKDGDRRKVFALTDEGLALLEAETLRLESVVKIGRKALGQEEAP